MAQTVKNLPAMRETWFQSLSQEDPLEKGTATHSVLLPGEFHGQRSLVKNLRALRPIADDSAVNE